MGRSEVRIGIVGAGRVARERHLPAFREIPGVKLRGVCNLRRESANRVAREFEIPRIYSSWEDLVEDPGIDAVVIATWPYVHCPITLAALDAGKHVLTQSRMAMNAREAQRMLDKSREHPNLTAMIVPGGYGLAGDAYVRSLIADGFLGTLREVHATGLNSEFADPKTPLSWRQITKYSGFNMLDLGVLYETALRWIAPAVLVRACASKLVPVRIDPETGQTTKVGVADSVQAITEQEDGSVGVYRVSGVVRHGLEASITLYGSEGTIRYDLLHDTIEGASRNDAAFRPLPIPSERRGAWNAEADFLAAIRGRPHPARTDFQTGVRYMHFTEAVARSSRHQQPVDLPLHEFSNPSL